MTRIEKGSEGHEFLVARRDLFERAVHSAPEHLRFLLIHHPDSPKLQGVVAGIKPAGEAFGLDAEEMAGFLNRVAGRQLFIHGGGMLANPTGVLHVIAHNPAAFGKNAEVAAALKAGREPDPARVLEASRGHVEAGLLYGFPPASVFKYARVEKHDPQGLFFSMLLKRMPDGERRVFEDYLSLTAEDHLKDPPRCRLIRRHAMAVVRKHTGEIINDLDEELKSEFDVNWQKVKESLFQKGLPMDSRRYFNRVVKPRLFGFMQSGDAFFTYGQSLADLNGFAMLDAKREALSATQFKQRVTRLKQLYPRPPEARPGLLLNKVVESIRRRTGGN